jgi:hypothetical protein
MVTGTVVSTLRTVMDILVLSSLVALLPQEFTRLRVLYFCLLQAPYRSLVSITIPILSNAWKEKTTKEINVFTKIINQSLTFFYIS